jgi:hypothetical protein
MRNPDLSARAGFAAERLQKAWQCWRALHGFREAPDPPASYVGYSLAEPMGEPRVVMGIDAAEAIRFADFLDRRDGLCAPRPAPAFSSGRSANAPVLSPQAAVAGLHTTEAEYPVLPSAAHRTTATRAFEQIPVQGTEPLRVSDPVGAEIASWTLSEQRSQSLP